MSQSRKPRRKNAPPPESGRSAPPPFSAESAFAAFVLGLWLARMLVPAESTPEGETLWLVQLTLLVALLGVWHRTRAGTFRIAWNGWDIAVACLAGGHVVSALAVVMTTGQKRASVNMLWEWLAVGMTYVMFRLLLNEPERRQQSLRAGISVATALASLGVWQHYVELPALARQIVPIVEELDHLEAGDPAVASSRATASRLAEIYRQYPDIPATTTARRAWLHRLRDSVEPFGLFALANTLAGVLLAWLLMSVRCVSVRFSSERSPVVRALLAAVPLVLVYCLLLTKSRTAWVACAVSAVTWAGGRIWRRTGSSRTPTVVTGVVAVLLAAGIGIAALGGGLDRKVISEAPKSLRYRLQYWSSTIQMLADAPVLGVGPGNFRENYLHYKLPEASEEIADPHNFLLDVWANGGLLALLGMVGVCTGLGRALLPSRKLDDAGQTGTEGNNISRSNIGFGGLAIAWGLTAFVSLALEATVDLRLIPLACIAGTVYWLLTVTGPKLSPRTPVWLSALAGVALLIHLLGAGGIEMPAISLTLLFFWAVSQPATASESANSAKPLLPGLWAGKVITAVMLLSFVLCLLTATVPVIQSQALVGAGDAAVMEYFLSPTAESLYRQAAAADSLSPEPPSRLAQVAIRHWQANPAKEAARFDEAVEYQRQAIALDPQSPWGYRTLALWYADRYRRYEKPDDGVSAEEAMRQAVTRYPASAALQSDLAIVQSTVGKSQQAAETASHAIALDQINREEGHSDKWLEVPTVERLEKILSPAKETP